MSLESLRVVAVVPASADRVYAAWLDSGEHSRMTGGKALVDPVIGGEHSAWDGYIEGKILELEPGRRIVQTWRTNDFPLGHADSRLEVHLLDVEGGCEVTIIHTEIPEGQGAKYESGWRDHYLEPMAKYFAKPARKPAGRKPAKKKAAKKPTRAGTRKAAKKPARKRASKKKGAKKAKRKK
jgi:uncharacterized protein YndB with AHSA1/START domain